MLYYEDEEINVTGNSSDIKYDAEVMDSFTDALASDIDRYKERARALEKEYVRYHNKRRIEYAFCRCGEENSFLSWRNIQ